MHRFVGAEQRIVSSVWKTSCADLAAIERIDHWLHDRDRAVVSARIGPRLEIVRGWDVPVRDLAGLVLVGAEMRDAFSPC